MKATSLYYGSRPVLGMGWCLWAPRSGRCALRPENGTTALRRDERSEAIAGRAARNTLAVVMLGLMVVTPFFGFGGRDQAPTALLAFLLAAAALTHFATDAWLRSRS